MCNLYNLYYTDAKNGQSYYDCMDDDFSIPSATYFPVGSDDPLPPNPLLEEHAHGSGHETHNLSSKADLNLVNFSFVYYRLKVVQLFVPSFRLLVSIFSISILAFYLSLPRCIFYYQVCVCEMMLMI